MTNQLKTLFLLGVLSAILVAAGGLIGEGALALFAVLAVAMNIGAYFFSDRIVLRMNRARALTPEAAPRLYAMVEDLAARAGIPAPKLYAIEDPHANAFATGRNPAHGVVAVTTGLMQTLNDREVRGVIAHEIAHIRNRDILIASIAATIAAVVSFIGTAAQWGAMLGVGRSSDDGRGGGVGALAAAIVAPIAATLVQLGISRSREFVADATAAELTGDPQGLASALATLHNRARMVPGHVAPATASLFIVAPFAGMRGLGTLFSTHPPMEARISRLQALTPARRG